jgi:hypothetical protein
MATTQVSRVHKGVRSILYINRRSFYSQSKNHSPIPSAASDQHKYSLELQMHCILLKRIHHTARRVAFQECFPYHSHAKKNPFRYAPHCRPDRKSLGSSCPCNKIQKGIHTVRFRVFLLAFSSQNPIPNDDADHKSSLCCVLAMKHGPESIHNRRTAQRECSILQPKTSIPIHAHRRRPSQHLISLQSCSVETNRNHTHNRLMLSYQSRLCFCTHIK